MINLTHVLKMCFGLSNGDVISRTTGMQYPSPLSVIRQFAHMFSAYSNAFEELVANCMIYCDRIWLQSCMQLGDANMALLNFQQCVLETKANLEQTLRRIPSHATLKMYVPFLCVLLCFYQFNRFRDTLFTQTQRFQVSDMAQVVPLDDAAQAPISADGHSAE